MKGIFFKEDCFVESKVFQRLVGAGILFAVLIILIGTLQQLEVAEGKKPTPKKQNLSLVQRLKKAESQFVNATGQANEASFFVLTSKQIKQMAASNSNINSSASPVNESDKKVVSDADKTSEKQVTVPEKIDQKKTLKESAGNLDIVKEEDVPEANRPSKEEGPVEKKDVLDGLKTQKKRNSNFASNIPVIDIKPRYSVSPEAKVQLVRKGAGDYADSEKNRRPKKLERKKQWMIQVGTFSQKTNGSHLLDHLVSKGWPAYKIDTGRFVKVFLGPIDNKSDAKKYKRKLKKNDHLNGFIREFQNG